MQSEIEESKRWCEGVIVQVAKGIQEAKEALEFLENSEKESPAPQEETPKSFWQKLFSGKSK